VSRSYLPSIGQSFLVLSNCCPTFQLLAGLSSPTRVEERSLSDDIEHAGEEACLNFSFIWVKAAVGCLEHKHGEGRQHEGIWYSISYDNRVPEILHVACRVGGMDSKRTQTTINQLMLDLMLNKN